jgi:hypothetical protein
MFYNINFFSFFEKIAQVTNLLYDKNWTKIYTLNFGVCLVPGVGLEEFSTPDNAIFALSGLLAIIWMEYS